MSMQATRVSRQGEGALSGTFEAKRPRDADVIREAHGLALQIETLLTDAAADGEPYGQRLTRALVRSLIDQLEDLDRDARRGL